MSQINHTADSPAPLLHSASHYDSPDDVLNDGRLSTNEKRVILSSWASDMYGVPSQPALREVPGIPRRLRLADILAALKRLDDEDDPPPCGGLTKPLPRLDQVDGTVSDASHRFADGRGTSRGRPLKISQPHSRWTREANVRRYRRLLKTQLTDIERDFIERRLIEELRG